MYTCAVSGGGEAKAGNSSNQIQALLDEKGRTIQSIKMERQVCSCVCV